MALLYAAEPCVCPSSLAVLNPSISPSPNASRIFTFAILFKLSSAVVGVLPPPFPPPPPEPITINSLLFI